MKKAAIETLNRMRLNEAGVSVNRVAMTLLHNAMNWLLVFKFLVLVSLVLVGIAITGESEPSNTFVGALIGASGFAVLAAVNALEKWQTSRQIQRSMLLGTAHAAQQYVEQRLMHSPFCRLYLKKMRQENAREELSYFELQHLESVYHYDAVNELLEDPQQQPKTNKIASLP